MWRKEGAKMRCVLKSVATEGNWGVIPQENAGGEMHFSIIPANRVRKLGEFVFFKQNHSLAKGCPWEDLQALSAHHMHRRSGFQQSEGVPSAKVQVLARGSWVGVYGDANGACEDMDAVQTLPATTSRRVCFQLWKIIPNHFLKLL